MQGVIGLILKVYKNITMSLHFYYSRKMVPCTFIHALRNLTWSYYKQKKVSVAPYCRLVCYTIHFPMFSLNDEPLSLLLRLTTEIFLPHKTHIDWEGSYWHRKILKGWGASPDIRAAGFLDQVPWTLRPINRPWNIGSDGTRANGSAESMHQLYDK